MDKFLRRIEHLFKQHRYIYLLQRSASHVLRRIIYARWYLFGRYKIFKTMKNDPGFEVNDKFLMSLLDRPIDNYNICRIKLCSPKRQWHEQIMPLSETATYAYIVDGDEARYHEYVRVVCTESGMNEKRIADVIDKDLARMSATIESIKHDGYDIRKQAVIIDERNVILDGLHRSSILWKLFGSEHEFDALRIYYRRLFR